MNLSLPLPALFAALLLPLSAARSAPPEPILAERASPEAFPPARLDSLLRASEAGPGRAGGRKAQAPRHTAVAVVFLATECPLSRAALPALNAFAARERVHGIALLGIVPREETGALEGMRREQGVNFPLAGDPDLSLAKALGAHVTPEAILLDSTGRVVYRGAIDDRAADLRRKRPRATRAHLDTAAAQWREGKPVQPAATRAVGCFIE